MSVISVLMGIYNENNRKHVAYAIDSILNQTFRDFEFIICDDGSEMGFYQWLKKYCRKDSRILLLRNEQNRGLAATLNYCLRHAGGSYIARMDADDISEKERFARQIAFLESHPEYAMVGCSVRMIGRKGVWGIRQMEEMPKKESFLNTSPFVHPAVMIRRDVMKALGSYSEKKWALRAEDYELFMRFYASGYKGYNIQEILLNYREEKDSYKKRKYRYRIHECIVRYRGFRTLGLLKGNYRYVIKPLMVGLIPSVMMERIRRQRYGMKGGGKGGYYDKSVSRCSRL